MKQSERQRIIESCAYQAMDYILAAEDDTKVKHQAIQLMDSVGETAYRERVVKWAEQMEEAYACLTISEQVDLLQKTGGNIIRGVIDGLAEVGMWYDAMCDEITGLMAGMLNAEAA